MLHSRNVSHPQARRFLFSTLSFSTRLLPRTTKYLPRSHQTLRTMMSAASPTSSVGGFSTSEQPVGVHPPIHPVATAVNAVTPTQKSYSIPIFTDLPTLREWRRKALREGKTVGFVPTMGALHDGHMSLVRRSLLANDLTVISIFVNPAQFAPHEDLGTYPRTLDADLTRIQALSVPAPDDTGSLRTTSALFLPSVRDMYPSGIVQNVEDQKGTFVEVKGYGHQMEGKSRPTFFRGVATVVTKLFNAVEPTNAYFGQKDIQQALLLRRLTRDLLLSHPTPANLHIVPTLRDSEDGLALSSRNAYLTPAERTYAPTLYASLKAGEKAWKAEGLSSHEAVAKAIDMVETVAAKAAKDGVDVKLDYIAMNDPETFEIVETNAKECHGRPVILSGALWVGRTRLIDNLLLGDASCILT